MKNTPIKQSTPSIFLRNLLLLLHCRGYLFRWGKRVLQLFPQIKERLLTIDDFTKVQVVQSSLPWKQVATSCLWGGQPGQRIITFWDADYPPLLRELADPPILLFVQGEVTILQTVQIAIVGSRSATPTGVKIARQFAGELAALGITITSGFARGIDLASHQAALEQNGKTIAVMGTGLNRCYPAHQWAFKQQLLAQNGVIVSEFPLEAGASSWHFPHRNRIISGLAVGTLVIEAARASGSLITARLAAEQGRSVWVVPGSIYNGQAAGSNLLIQDGAQLVTNVTDILNTLPLPLREQFRPHSPSAKITAQNQLDSLSQKLLDCIGFELTLVDELQKRSGLPIELINQGLCDLEERRLIERFMGGYIRLTQ